jgi:uncharacterized protein (TIGR00255 family)
MKSMTGFSGHDALVGGTKCRIEIASVNRKQCDIELRLPRDWQGLEGDVRKVVAAVVSRGRVHVTISLDASHARQTSLKVDGALAAEYATALSEMVGSPVMLSAEMMLRAPGIFAVVESRSVPSDAAWPELEPALREALTAWNASRQREGEHLAADIKARLATIEALAGRITQEAPRIPIVYRETLQKRLAEVGLPLPLDDERLLKEVALFADRCDISEEVARLAGHLTEFRRLLDHDPAPGRPLDFLSQELHRELNTIGSKANHAALSHMVVAGKTEVERIREQVQNLE